MPTKSGSINRESVARTSVSASLMQTITLMSVFPPFPRLPGFFRLDDLHFGCMAAALALSNFEFDHIAREELAVTLHLDDVAVVDEDRAALPSAIQRHDEAIASQPALHSSLLSHFKNLPFRSKNILSRLRLGSWEARYCVSGSGLR